MTAVPSYIAWQSRRTPTTIETELVYRDPRYSDIVSRVGGLLSIYFLDGWTTQKRRQLLAVVEEYCDLFADRITHYQTPGERQLRSFNVNEAVEYYEEISKNEESEMYCFLKGVNAMDNDDPSLWLLIAFGFERDNSQRHLSGVKIHVPPAFILDNPDRCVDLVRRWSERLGAVHGSGGLGVLTEPGRETVGKVLYYPLMQRYPALEYDNMGGYFSGTRFGGYEVPRASNWLTLLGDANIARLGGEDAIRSQLTPELTLVPYAGGVLIRAGQAPVVDSNGIGGIPQAYRDAARIIKPIRFEGYRRSIIEVPEEKDDLEETLKWVRRFD
ncbi:type VI immunity family protein [Methylobacterium sp. Leaf112]|uniref:type VI immunity family protein n=1 Tax=Methylobacterium sp. Leaf112 TaxID=1736258 RepID=UPI0006F64361|nr:type VI immunity family protein [Methylobacterium sp. Leaf112]KQP68060.1 hypothetical protein ASF52_17985 [Methylobacterium sp. Leaf112]